MSENRIQLLIFFVVGLSLSLIVIIFILTPTGQWEVSNYLSTIGLSLTAIELIFLAIARKSNRDS